MEITKQDFKDVVHAYALYRRVKVAITKDREHRGPIDAEMIYLLKTINEALPSGEIEPDLIEKELKNLNDILLMLHEATDEPIIITHLLNISKLLNRIKNGTN